MFLFLSFIVIVISFFLFKAAAGTMSIHRPNLISLVFYIHLFLTSFIGVNLAMLGIEHYSMSRASFEAIEKAYYSVLYVMICMPLSMIIFQKLFFGGNIKRKINSYYESTACPLQSESDSAIIFYLSVFLLICLLSTVYTYYIIKNPPYIELLMGASPDSVARYRILAKQEFNGNVYVRGLLSVLTSQIVAYIFYGYYRLNNTLFNRYGFYLSVIVAVFAVTYSGEKQPIIIFFLTLIIIKGIFDGGFSRNMLIASLVSTVLMIIGIYAMFGIGWEMSLTSGPIGRVLIGQISSLPLMFDVFPDRVHFLNGASFPPWLSGLFGLENIRPGALIQQLYHPENVRKGTAGVANTLFIGEAWANFGWFGFLFSPVIVGFVVQYIHNFFVSRPKTPIYVGLLGFFLFGTPITGGFVDFLWNASWIYLIAFTIAGLLFRSFIMGAIYEGNSSVAVGSK